MPLTIERIGRKIITPFGEGNLYSLCHYFELNRDLIQDPEMCFVMIDNRAQDRDSISLVTVLPYMYQDASMGVYQESISIEYNRLYQFDRRMQRDHTHFANQWLENIKSQGFLGEDT